MENNNKSFPSWKITTNPFPVSTGWGGGYRLR